tara:strand:- start:1870 stop:2262 length:393 start_codon:yes stop_codon:yes gene_type:complete
MSKENEKISPSCIICLDILDENNESCTLSENLLKTTCKCKYNIHKNCLNKWLILRNSDNISCLVCASEANVVTTTKEKCNRNFSRFMSPKKICKPCFFVCLFFCWIFTIYPTNEQDNDSINTDDASTPVT